MEWVGSANGCNGLLEQYLVVGLDDERRHVAATGVAGEAHLVFLARHQAGDHLAQRAATLQEGDQVLVLRLAVVGERAGPVEVDAVIPGAHPAGDRLGLDVTGPGRRAAGLEAGVHNDDVALVTLDDGNGVVNHRGIARCLAAKHHLGGVAFRGEHDGLAVVGVRPAHGL